MRIGFDATCLPPFIAGAGRYICGLVSGLSAEDRSNEYYIISKKQDRHLFADLPENFHLIEVPNLSRPLRVGWQLSAPRSLSTKHKLDVWHAPHYTLPRGMQGIYSVVTFHDMTFFLYPHFYNPAKRLFFQRMIRDATNRADAIVAVSKTTENDIRHLFGQSTHKLTHVYSGINGHFKPDSHHRRTAFEQFRINKDEKFILFVGTFEKRKNLPVLLQAFERTLQQGLSNLKLVLVGREENGHEELSKAVRSLGIADHIIMPGYVRDSELQALYSAASLCVIPSHYEGFGFPVLEAMASGTPVLTSNVSATKEVAANPDMLVEPDDIDAWTAKIYQALTDERFRNRLIEHGRSQSQKFSWRQTAREMINVYEGAHQSKPKIANLKTKVSVENYHALPDVVMQSELPHFANVSALSNAVLCTLVYSDLFHYPLKLEEIHEGLVGYKASIDEVKDVLQGEELKRYVDYANGFYFLKDVKEKIDNRKLNEQTSHKILLKNRRLLKFICNFPFVRAVALSGAIAFNNCKSNDDVDLFLLIDSKRIWCVYFVLAALLKVLRKRNLICLNYLYGKEDLVVNETDFYVAHQIANLRPISGNGVLADFISANEWILNYLPQTKPGNSNYVSGKNGQLDMNGKNVESRSKRALEKFLGLDMFNQIEDWVFRVYSGHIRKITSHLNGSVVVEKDQIKLFTHDHRQRILSKFKTRLDEIAKL